MADRLARDCHYDSRRRCMDKAGCGLVEARDHFAFQNVLADADAGFRRSAGMLEQGNEQPGWQGCVEYRSCAGNILVVLQPQAAVKMEKPFTSMPCLFPKLFLRPLIR